MTDMDKYADKPRVLMVGPDRSVHGGISAMVNNYYDAGLDKGVDLKYIGTMKEGSRAKKLVVAAAAYFKFLFFLRDYDIVHVNASSDSSFMRKSFFIRAAKRHGKKIILHQHGGDFRNYYENQISQKRREYIKRTLDMADIVFVLTESWRDYFGKITDPGKIIVLPNGIVTSYKHIHENIPEHSLYKILFLGRVCRDKGMDELLEAVDKIHVTNPDVRLYIGGIYEDKSYEKKIADRSEYIKFAGWVTGEDKQKLLDECGILVLPSYYEGFPVSIVEGMYNGLVTVASSVGGIPEIIESGKNGMLIPAKDSASLEKTLRLIIEKQVNVEEIIENGRRTVAEKYSVERDLEILIELYKKM